MAVQMVFFKYPKRTNSTSTPIITDLDSTTQSRQSGEIKQPFDILSLSVSVIPKGGVFTNPFDWNYLYIPSLKRYYFISGWTFQQGIYNAACYCDVLGTWKRQIGSSFQYVTRAQSRSNGKVVDTLYPTLAGEYSTQYFDVATTRTLYQTDITKCTYVIGCISNYQHYKFGSNNYYICDYNGLAAILYAMLSSTDYLNISDVSDGLAKALCNPMDYITMCYMLPINFNDITKFEDHKTDYFYFGWWDLSLQEYSQINVYFADPSTSAVQHRRVTFDIQKHPQAETRGTYLNGETYNNYSVYVQPFGYIQLDTQTLMDYSYFHLDYEMDIIGRSVKATLYVTNNKNSPYGNGKLFGQLISNDYGVQLTMSSITTKQNVTDVGQWITTAAGSAVSWITSQPFFSGVVEHLTNAWRKITSGPMAPGMTEEEVSNVAAAAKGIGQNAAKIASNGCNVNSVGGSGSRLSYLTPFFMQHKYKLIADENINEIGRPLCELVNINSLSGFIQCSNADVGSINCLYAQKSQIEQYLNNGFHFE